MTAQLNESAKGLLASLATLASTLVSIAYTRLDLLSNDIEEDREHILSLLLLALVALFCLGLGLLLAALLLVAAFWDTHRLLVMGILAGSFLTAGVAVWVHALHKARNKPRIFTSSLSELLKDRQQLDARP